MKFFLVLIALVGYASSQINPDLVKCELFLACAKKAIDGGVPAIPIPNHNPLHIRNVTFNGSVLLTDYYIGVTNNILYSLVDYNVTYLTATSYTNPGRVAFDYNIYWPKLNFTGEFELEIDTLFIKQHIQGTYNVVAHEVNWYGIFNLTKPGQPNIKEHLDDFTLHSKTESVDVTITGLGIGNFAAEQAIKLGATTLLNHVPAAAATFLKDQRFNGFWFAHPEKIDQIISFCKQNMF